MPSAKRSPDSLSVFFIVPAPPGISPGQRFRFELYLEELERNNIRYQLSHFYSPEGWRTLYRHGNRFRKLASVLTGCLRRWLDLFRALPYTYIYIYREAAPLGPPFFEWCWARLFRKKIIYDFDDAIWIPVTSEYNKMASRLKNFSKVGRLCRWSYRVSAGNEFLASYARKFNERVSVVPTVVNTDTGHNRIQDQSSEHPAIGWTGTFSTLPYLDGVLPVLQELQEKIDFDFYVIADKDPALSLKHYRFVPWSRENEVEDLMRFHIGLMPLTDDEVSKGKCGFKAIQYMSLGIPAVVSPVGVNTKIVEDNVNGFICSTPEEWKSRLEQLLGDRSLRERLGKSAREKIINSYSVRATYRHFLDLFN